MGILTDDMRRVVERQRLGFVATVCPDGTPNVSPKGTVAVERALPVISPAYDTGATEDEVRTRWRRYWSAIERDGTPPASD